MKIPAPIAAILQEPPPSMVFELSEAGISVARLAAKTELDFRPLKPGVLAITPLKDNVVMPDELSAAIAAVCALDHFDWLAVMSALVNGGPGTPASAADLARYVRDFDPDEIIGLEVVPNDDDFADEDLDDDTVEGYDDDFDELSIEGLFLHVTAMWSVLGAIDSDDRLTALGWWGLPEAMRRAWAEPE